MLNYIILVGPPAVGKSTYIKRFHPDAFIVSRDDIVDEVAKSKGLTYDDLFINPPENAEINQTSPGYEHLGIVIQGRFGKAFKNIEDANDTVHRILQSRFSQAISSKKDVVIDMTNMTKASRRLALQHPNEQYKKIAVVFPVQKENMDELLQRMHRRSEAIKAKGGSKTIGEPVIRRMLDQYQPVSYDEGFDEIKTVPFGS